MELTVVVAGTIQNSPDYAPFRPDIVAATAEREAAKLGRVVVGEPRFKRSAVSLFDDGYGNPAGTPVSYYVVDTVDPTAAS